MELDIKIGDAVLWLSAMYLAIGIGITAFHVATKCKGKSNGK